MSYSSYVGTAPDDRLTLIGIPYSCPESLKLNAGQRIKLDHERSFYILTNPLFTNYPSI